jgi:valyl-tRNA synthetase
MGRNFANKVWNASRFTLMNLGAGGDGAPADPEQLRQARRFEDRWILSRLSATAAEVSEYLENFRASEAAQAVYDFFWHEFCDWYLEAAKLRIRDSEEALDRAVARETLARALDDSLRLLQPFAPFLSETLWQELKPAARKAGLVAAQRMQAEALIVAPWPEPEAALRDAQIEGQMRFLQDIVRAVRHLRKEKGIAESRPIKVALSCPDPETDRLVEEHAEFLRTMGVLEGLEHAVGLEKPARCAAILVGTTQVYMQLEGVVDLKQERERLEQQRRDAADYIQKLEQQLNNPDFLVNAPEEIVQRQMDKAQELREQLQKVEQHLAELQ